MKRGSVLQRLSVDLLVSLIPFPEWFDQCFSERKLTCDRFDFPSINRTEKRVTSSSKRSKPSTA
jgi:hypothetical protein